LILLRNYRKPLSLTSSLLPTRSRIPRPRSTTSLLFVRASRCLLPDVVASRERHVYGIEPAMPTRERCGRMVVEEHKVSEII